MEELDLLKRLEEEYSSFEYQIELYKMILKIVFDVKWILIISIIRIWFGVHWCLAFNR
jgi:hypothetical protein